MEGVELARNPLKLAPSYTSTSLAGFASKLMCPCQRGLELPLSLR